ncbi:MAG: GDP-mannose 4,6-dehydratase [Acidobacteria bacterium]|jgi:UDP-glucuronate 4-epimerase|nr:GDP-mannose 4,6-dehydratase [Acidobacteriota bacterium]
MNKNILITGGAGFIGSHLVDRLLAEGKWQVTVVDDFNDFYSPLYKRANIAAHLENPDYRLHEIDICDAEGLREVFAGSKFDAIVHLAARTGVRPSLCQPQAYAETNINGTLNLLELAREFAVKQFIFGSSSSVYGINSKVPFSEEDKISQPISPYAATKAAGELLCHTYSHLYPIRTVCLRFFTVYGARQRPDLAVRKFSRLIVEGKPIEVFGDGTTRRDYTYIDDIIQGVRAAIDYHETPHEIFNLGESQTVELRELVSLLEQNLGIKAIIERKPTQPGDVPQTFADITKAREFLNYNPQTKIEEGIKKFVEWFSRQISDPRLSFGTSASYNLKSGI